MNVMQDKVLLMAGPDTAALVKKSMQRFSNLEILEAPNENKAFEYIYNHSLVLLIIDETLPAIEPYRIGSMLMSHKQIHNTPLLILCDRIKQNNFLNDFDALQIDHLLMPFTAEQLCAKIKLFFELFMQKNAVDQSLSELENVYQKIVSDHEKTLTEDVALKRLAGKSTNAVNQIQQSLRSLSGSLYPVIQDRNQDSTTRLRLASVKSAAEQISLTTKKLLSQISHSRVEHRDTTYSFLYIQDSDEDFRIFEYYIKTVVHCDLFQSIGIEKSLELISKKNFDLIFIDFHQPGGNGFDILVQLNRMRANIPVVFTIDKPFAAKGPVAVSKGAYSYLIKEELSSAHILSIIRNTLEKAQLIQEVEDAQNRIVTISRKDFLTKLYNRRCFEQELESEISKAKRYKTRLSIIMLDFDQFQTINETYGLDAGDGVLTVSAAIIQGMVRNNDVVCRYGGEEFGIVLPNTPLNGARYLAERIRKVMSNHDFITGDAKTQLTVSLGVTEFDRKLDLSYSELARQGLDALAEAVDSGGNCVFAYQHPSKET